MSNLIDKNEILTILNDWNFWQQDLEIGIKRKTYLPRIKNHVQTNQIIVITGARRSGKSFIMRQLAKELMNQGLLASQILMINFEDPRWPKLDTKILQSIYETYLEDLNPKSRPYIFLDEIQEVKDWEKWALTMRELQKAKIILSGSNAKLLSQELATLLTGRHLDTTVFPLSFREFLEFKNVKIKNQLDLINQRIAVKRLLSEYLEFGSFPEVVLSKVKQEILLRYFDDILHKDLIKRYKIRKIQSLKSLTKFYLSNVSCLITFNSLEKFLNISNDSIEKFSDYLSSAYLIFFLKRFSFKVREQEKSPRKVYAIDTGLANTIGFRFSENRGRILENIVFLELRRQQAVETNLELYFWKDQRHREVDFVIKQNLKIKQLIQVCYNIEDYDTKKREIRSLLKASKELKCSNLLIITDDYEADLPAEALAKAGEKINGKSIKFIPLWKWLLQL